MENQPAAPPTEKDDEEFLGSMLETVTNQLRPTKVIPETDREVARPGSSYARYRVETDLPEKARPFYETAAKVVGISLSTLIKAVFQAEVKMDKWQEDRRRLEYYGEPMDTEAIGCDNET